MSQPPPRPTTHRSATPRTPPPRPPAPGPPTPPAAGTGRTDDARPGGAPAAAPRYGLSARLADWVQARADGRAGLPSLEPGRPAGTPTLETLAQDFLVRSHRERLRLDLESAPLLEQAAQLEARIAEAERGVARAAEDLARWPMLPDEKQLTLRRGGETLTAVDVVRARRAREYDAQRRPLVDAEAGMRRGLGGMRVELARVRTAVRAREVAGATRVRRLHAQTMRRISAYERHLVRRHPAGDRIGPVLAAQHPRVPGWVTQAEAAADTVDSVGAAVPAEGGTGPRPDGAPAPRPEHRVDEADVPRGRSAPDTATGLGQGPR